MIRRLKMVRVVETTAVRGMILLCALNGLGASAAKRLATECGRSRAFGLLN